MMEEYLVELSLRLDDGRTTVLEQWGDRGPCIVAVHGITSSRKSWQRLGEALEGRARLFAYDQRGHGDSAHVEGPMTHERSVADLRNVVAALPEPPLAVIGHSWGGAIALLAGINLPFERVVAIDPMVYVEPGSWRREFLDDVEADLALAPDERERVLRERLASWDERDIEGKIHAMRTMSPRAIARLGSENRVDDGGWDLRTRIAGYPKPLLLLVAGPDDSVIAANDLETLHRTAGPNAEIKVFADQGHNLHRSAFDRFLAEVCAFLAH